MKSNAGFKLHSGHIEVAVANLFGYRRNIIVPNVSWGLGLRHECDVLICNNNLFLTEVEIKISKADLRADKLKPHAHNSRVIKHLYFAIPERMNTQDCLDLIPERAGIIVVNEKIKARFVRRAKSNRFCEKIDENKIHKLLHLGVMRIWTLKTRLYEKQR